MDKPAIIDGLHSRVLRDMDHGAERALKIVGDAITKGFEAGEIVSPVQCVEIIDRVRLSFSREPTPHSAVIHTAPESKDGWANLGRHGRKRPVMQDTDYGEGN